MSHIFKTEKYTYFFLHVKLLYKILKFSPKNIQENSKFEKHARPDMLAN